ncbi:MAG TPA: adenylate/guanylate cyclase domain-containing protein [Bryobacteraceae bacterium]|jgi:adenylate cyclase|nr:adenylate/guanylate cyclase domain-containing protein [Bryobacteraceae bacterium]
MKRNWKRVAICAAIAIGATVVTRLLSNISFFHLLDLKARDAHFVLRGKQPTRDIVILGMDDKTLAKYPEPLLFWGHHFAAALKAAADAGAKTFVIDVSFQIPAGKYDPDNDAELAEAFTYATAKMPLVTAFVPSQADPKDPAFAVPINMLAGAFGTAGLANLTADDDDFIRRQVLIETPDPKIPFETLKRSMALHAAEGFLGKTTTLRDGKLYLGDRFMPTDEDRNIVINFAGPTDTFPRVSLVDFIDAAQAGNQKQLEKWVKGKIVMMGPDSKTDTDRHATPFYTSFGSTDKYRTAGIEIHANALQTLLSGNFLQAAPRWAMIVAPLAVAGITVAIAASFAATQTALWSFAVIVVGLLVSHLFFIKGWLVSDVDLGEAFVISLLGGVVYRFTTAEEKSTFFKSAVALFVGKQVAQSLDASGKIGLTGKRGVVTILFTDIRGFTAFCESKDPALIVDLLNVYMATMCSFIVKYKGHVNKFIGDGILAVFSDDDEGAKPGDHASRALQCAVDMVSAPNEFKTGAGLHTGEVVIGNVGSSDKMEFTVLGDTVNLASRLESLNKEHKTKMLLSDAVLAYAGDAIETKFLGEVPVRGKTEPMKLYTVTSTFGPYPTPSSETTLAATK